MTTASPVVLPHELVVRMEPSRKLSAYQLHRGVGKTGAVTSRTLQQQRSQARDSDINLISAHLVAGAGPPPNSHKHDTRGGGIQEVKSSDHDGVVFESLHAMCLGVGRQGRRWAGSAARREMSRQRRAQ